MYYMQKCNTNLDNSQKSDGRLALPLFPGKRRATSRTQTPWHRRGEHWQRARLPSEQPGMTSKKHYRITRFAMIHSLHAWENIQLARAHDKLPMLRS